MMRVLLIMLLAALSGAGPAFAEDTGQPGAVRVPASTASGYPPAGGRGAGSGHSYQQGTAGPGRGSPNYQGERGDTPAPSASTGNSALPPADIASGAVIPKTAPASSETLPAVPGPYSRPTGTNYPDTSGSTYPYYGGRGRGYGRHRRGYGYGYPGYRGLGGGQYPHHRQFGNPPMYPVQPATVAPPAAAE